MTRHTRARGIVSAVIVAAGLLTAAHSQEPRPPGSVADAASLDDSQLPRKSVFAPAMPRYPNVWFYVDASLADSQATAMRLVAEQVRAALRVRESYGPFSNPEGADFEVTIEHLQPWEVPEHRPCSTRTRSTCAIPFGACGTETRSRHAPDPRRQARLLSRRRLRPL